MANTPQGIVSAAIEEWQPRHIVCLFSGGYDSMCMTHLVHRLDLHGVSMSVWAIDTQLSADGWRQYIRGVADELDFSDFNIFDNKKGWNQYVEWVREYGCPRGNGGHNRAYVRLKERGMDAIHMMYKRERQDKTLFLSGMRKYESRQREASMHEPVQRSGRSNKIFANPLFHWRDDDIARYRIEHDLPDNPFYATLTSSGDCHCNWGEFITLGTLRKYSPDLANGNVALLDKLSREVAGFGWDGELDIDPLFDLDEVDHCELTSPFLCSNCSRAGKPRHIAAEEIMMQRGLF